LAEVITDITDQLKQLILGRHMWKRECNILHISIGISDTSLT